MPAIVVFGRKWSLASDDFVYPCILEFLIHFIWLVLIIVVILVEKDTVFMCTSGTLFKVVYIGLIATMAVVLPVTIVEAVCAAQGGIMEVEKRRFVVPLFYAKHTIYIIEAGFLILGLYWSFAHLDDCDEDMVFVMRGVSIAGCVMYFVYLAVWLIAFNPLGKITESMDMNDAEMSRSKVIWQKRCRMLCCSCRAQDIEQEAFIDIADILVDFFQDMDLVPTDIAAGFMLLREDERREGASDTGLMSPVLFQEETSDVDPFDLSLKENDWRATHLICHYSKFALAAYGWPLFAFSNLCRCGLCRLCCCRCRLCQRCDKDRPITPHCDNSCECNMAAILEITGLPEENFIYVTFHNKLYSSPFMVVVDDDTRSIVIAIRGTLSLKDIVTDMVASTSLINDGNLEPNFAAHSGILKNAKNILQQLEEMQLIEKALEKRPGYSLVATGHSLGAGTASVLSVLLKCKYPNVKCYAYAPPLGLVNQPLAIYCESFILSVFLGYDIVPRLSLDSLNNLKERLLQALKLSDEPKYKILARCAILTCCCDPASKALGLRRVSSLSRQNIHGRPLLRTQLSPDLSLPYSDMDSSDSRRIRERLYFAGQCFHIIELEQTENEEFDYQTRYAGVWTHRDRFNTVVVHPRMLSDHMPDKLQRALLELQSQSEAGRILTRQLNSTIESPSTIYS